MSKLFHKRSNNLRNKRLDDSVPIPSCTLCGEINNYYTPPHTLFAPTLQTRILYETNNWIVIPSLGPLTLGHIMLVPRNHYYSVLSCSEDVLFECEKLLDYCSSKLNLIYQQPIILFEHGSASEHLEHSGACIDHAHLHLAPGPVSFISDVISEFDGWQCSDNLVGIAQPFTDKPYILVGTGRQPMSIWVHGCIEVPPSQFLRSIFASQLGISDKWNWRSNLNPEIFIQTVDDWSNVESCLHD